MYGNYLSNNTSQFMCLNMAEVAIRFLVAWSIASFYLEKQGAGAQSTSVDFLASNFSFTTSSLSPWQSPSSLKPSMPSISPTPSSSSLNSTFILTETAESSRHVTTTSAADDTVAPIPSSSFSQTTSTAVPPTSSIVPTSTGGDNGKEDADAEKKRTLTMYLLYACLGVFFLIFIILVVVAVQVSRLNKVLKGRISGRR